MKKKTLVDAIMDDVSRMNKFQYILAVACDDEGNLVVVRPQHNAGQFYFSTNISQSPIEYGPYPSNMYADIADRVKSMLVPIEDEEEDV